MLSDLCDLTFRRSLPHLSVINLGKIYYNMVKERGSEQAGEKMFMIAPLLISASDADIAITGGCSPGMPLSARAVFFAAAPGILKKGKSRNG